MEMLCYGLSDVGKVRSQNEDSIYLNEELRLFMVADGIGGHRAGDVASFQTVKYVSLYVQEKKDKKLKGRSFLKKAILQANSKVYQLSKEKNKYKGMGTTLTVAYFQGSQLFIGNVGDSRIYLINNKNIFGLTKDHTLVQEKVNLGIISPKEARFDKLRNIITRTVGHDPQVNVDIFSYKVHIHDIFLICSDGLHQMLTDEEILFIINQEIPDPSIADQEQIEKTVAQLVDRACENGGLDNVSVILLLALKEKR